MSILADLFIREYGQSPQEAPCIVFIHGLLGWGLNWSPVIKYFEKDYHILVYDQRGHGRSFQPKEGYAPEDYAQDLKQLLEAKGISRAHIVGHSMGARTAQSFCYSHPGSCLSLVMEDMGPSPEPESSYSTKEMIAGVPVPFVDSKAMQAYFANDFPSDGDNKAMAQFLMANLQRQKDGRVSWRFSYDGVMQTIEEGLRPRWTEFKCLQVPTLVVRGEKSRHLSAKTLELMEESLSLAQVRTVEGTGHWIHYEKPKDFSQHVLEFLQSLG